MDMTPKQFVLRLGGYREVAARIGISPKTMHAYSLRRRLPAGLYAACCELAREKGSEQPTPSLFDFKPLIERVAA
ncbi:hypothetical protein [Sulfitobacter pontiacus]|uniref:hypothetical protein n=1 Tax=Sulfitobacter pontiacus TaxID=60137 RepID=UPI0021A36F4A|nr:hypothetical protein [Sulfitobacter pontiacus]UWR17780.1 hypothetical protein K3755_08715 [Sulfitobacter pontiacus]